MNAPHSSECPVCSGKGFVTTVADRRVKSDRRRTSARATVQNNFISPFVPIQDECLPEFFARILLRHYDHRFVAKLFRQLGSHNSPRVMRAGTWLDIAEKLEQGIAP